jgi:threonine dehydrogenase-like Zn-dependent dehydrogenase
MTRRRACRGGGHSPCKVSGWCMPTLGETVVVIGLGLIGLVTVQILRAKGCRVLGLDSRCREAGHRA